MPFTGCQLWPALSSYMVYFGWIWLDFQLWDKYPITSWNQHAFTVNADLLYSCSLSLPLCSLIFSCWLLLSNLLFQDIFIIYICISQIPFARGQKSGSTDVHWCLQWVSCKSNEHHCNNDRTLKVFFHLKKDRAGTLAICWHRKERIQYTRNGLFKKYNLEVKDWIITKQTDRKALVCRNFQICHRKI